MMNIHQYKSRPEGFCVNSWLVETEKSVVLIDCQFLASEAGSLVEKIRRLGGKPLEALFITHPHPDHFNGAGIVATAFPRVRIIATKKTNEGIINADAPKRQ